MPKTKYIFVSGGVISSLGKGVTAASIALLLKNRGYKVTPVKCENYLNIDAGLINPIEHGDPFLCDDGTEADMDLGTYEKFLGQNVGRNNFITMGQIYQAVIQRERNFGYNGEDVEAIPHVCDEIIKRIKEAGKEDSAEIVIIELGGTAGEYQNALYYEASRIMKFRDRDTVIHVHVSYLPTPSHIGEPKTKPTQLSVRTLNSMGINPDFIVARAEREIDERRRQRFSLFCNVPADHIINNPDLPTPYEIPLVFEKQEFIQKILTLLDLSQKSVKLDEWKSLVEKSKKKTGSEKTIAIVGKYFATGEYQLKDSYAALLDALDHAVTHWQANIKIKFVNSERLEKNGIGDLQNVQGIIVPIGWGERGVEGKIKAIQYARENKIPYLGLCYGMQLAVVEFARNVLDWKDAHTTEVNPKTFHPVIHTIKAQEEILKRRAYGGTMRLGAWQCKVKEGTETYNIYKKWHHKLPVISERHRHRYEFNNECRKELEKNGLVISGEATLEPLVEIIELPKSVHPFFIGTQFHPEYKSRPLSPHPLFLEFIYKVSNGK